MQNKRESLHDLSTKIHNFMTLYGHENTLRKRVGGNMSDYDNHMKIGGRAGM